MHQVASLGYPSGGVREAVAQWRNGALDDWGLERMAQAARRGGWAAQKAAGIDMIPSGELGYGDPMAETAAMVGAVPARFGPDIGRAALEVRLALANGTAGETPATAAWAGTHLRYVTPVLRDDDRWRLNAARPVAEQLEARSFGIVSRPVLIGPISFLMHCRTADGRPPLAYLDRVLPAYREMLAQHAIHGAAWVQMDEPALAGDVDDSVLQEFARAYAQLNGTGPRPKLMVATYGGGAAAALDVLVAAGIDGLHVDLVAAPDQLMRVARGWTGDRVLSVGVVDAASPAPTNQARALGLLRDAADALGGDRVQVAPSMPLTAAPVDLARVPLDLATTIETAADKLRVLRRIADAAASGGALSDAAAPLPARPELAPARLA
ncbi:MAG: hypothetical protein R3F55_01735 [Alphaproteobacteria bacterium]